MYRQLYIIYRNDRPRRYRQFYVYTGMRGRGGTEICTKFTEMTGGRGTVNCTYFIGKRGSAWRYRQLYII
jgi:hypothetical protein